MLRRFRASHFAPWALPLAWIAVATVLAVVAIVALLVTAQLAFGLPSFGNVPLSLLGLALGVWTSISTGLVLGLAMPTARAAQSLGLALFFPSFLLGGAGPPPDVQPAAMRTIGNFVPTTHVVKAMQEPWLGIGTSPWPHLAVLTFVGIVTTVGWCRLARRATDR